MTTGRPSASAIGSAVSCARSSGELRDARCPGCRKCSATRSAISLPQLGKVIVGQPAVEQPGRVVHLTVSHEMHNRPALTHPGLLVRYPEALAAAAAAAGSASTIRFIGSIIVRGGKKPSFVRARRQVDAGSSIEWKNAAYARGGLPRGGGVVRHGGHALGYEENAEQVPSALDDVRHTGRVKGSLHLGPQLRRRAVELLIDLGGRQPQRRVRPAAVAMGFPERVPAW